MIINWANSEFLYPFSVFGGFQLEFVSISRVTNCMTCYKFKCSHWLKLQHSDWRANLEKGSTRFITGHVIYNPAYAYKFQLKTTFISIFSLLCTGLDSQWFIRPRNKVMKNRIIFILRKIWSSKRILISKVSKFFAISLC